MAINFPDSPSTSDTFVVGDITYVYNGSVWSSLGVDGSNFLQLSGGTVTGEVVFENQITTQSGSDVGTTGTLTIDFSGSSSLSTGTFIGGASDYTLSFPADWIFVGDKPTQISSGKTGILTLASFDASDSDVIAAYSSEQ